MNYEFCEKCGCQKDEDYMNSKYCEDCYLELLEEHEIYL